MQVLKMDKYIKTLNIFIESSSDSERLSSAITSSLCVTAENNTDFNLCQDMPCSKCIFNNSKNSVDSINISKAKKLLK